MFAEIEVYGHLKKLFDEMPVRVVKENFGKNGKSPDFQVGDDLFVEVYCPDVSIEEKEDVKKKLAEAAEDVVNAEISRPLTRNKTNAIKFSTNKIIDKVLNAKGKNDQAKTDAKNIIWVDLKKKWQRTVNDTLPLQSVNHGNHTYIGCFGIWHSLYGKVGASLFPEDRFNLAYPNDLPWRLPVRDEDQRAVVYQQTSEGLFRQRQSLSAAIISCVDGNVLFLNPWALRPLDDEQVLRLIKLYHFRPEYSLFMRSSIEREVAAREEMIQFLLRANRPDLTPKPRTLELSNSSSFEFNRRLITD